MMSEWVSQAIATASHTPPSLFLLQSMQTRGKKECLVEVDNRYRILGLDLMKPLLRY
jgi:hypothetical protein